MRKRREPLTYFVSVGRGRRGGGGESFAKLRSRGTRLRRRLNSGHHLSIYLSVVDHPRSIRSRSDGGNSCLAAEETASVRAGAGRSFVQNRDASGTSASVSVLQPRIFGPRRSFANSLGFSEVRILKSLVPACLGTLG